MQVRHILCFSGADTVAMSPQSQLQSRSQLIHVPHAPFLPSSGVELDVLLQRASGVSTRKVYHPAILGSLLSSVSMSSMMY